MIDAQVEFVGRVAAAGREIECPARGVRQRIKRQIVQRFPSEPALGNDVAGERIAQRLAGAIRIGANCGGVVQRRAQLGEIAAPHSRRRDRRIESLRPADARAFVVAKNEGAVLAVIQLGNVDRSAERESELILFHGRADAGRIEEIARVQNLVADELESASV